jgi:hypothetical protein
MKVLSMNFYFLLPDDFDGNLNGALLEIVKYRRHQKSPDYPLKNNMTDEDKKNLFNDFLKAQSEGFKLYGGAFLGEWDEKSLTWKRLNDNE